MRILLMRHAETWENQAQRMQGRRDAPLSRDRPQELSPQGQQQVAALANYLSHRYRQFQPDPCPPAQCGEGRPSKTLQLYSSPQRRCRETLTRLLQDCPPSQPHSPIQPTIRLDPRLQEVDLGILSGLTWAEAEATYPDLCQTLMQQLDWHPIPAAESPQDCRQRATSFIQTLMLDTESVDEVWIVTHAGILSYLLSAILGSNKIWGLSIPNTALFEFEVNRDRWQNPDSAINSTLWQIHHFGDTPHLTNQQIAPHKP